MKGLVITHNGLENVAADEVKELIKSESKTEPCIAVFTAKKDDLIELAYMGQSFIKVLEYIASLDLDDKFFENIKSIISKIKIKKPFRVKCKRLGEHSFSSHEIEEAIGEVIINNNDAKVNLSEPEIIIYTYITGTRCHIGYDVSGTDLSKRDYKVFIHPASLKGTIAYSLLKFSGYKGNKVLLDPFCGSGTIPIEAALYAKKFSHNFFSKNRFIIAPETLDKYDRKKNTKTNITGYDFLLKNVKAAKKNAKIAGILDSISFSKIDIEWLDTKFDEGYVDMIVTNPPMLAKHMKENEYLGLMKEFWYQAKYLVKKKGNVTLITNAKCLKIMEDISPRYDFSLNAKIDISIGEEHLKIVRFIKEK